MGGGYVGIDLRGRDRAVAEEGLYVADVHARLQQRGREGVPEHMRRDMPGRLRSPRIAAYDPPHRLRRQRPAPAVIKNITLLRYLTGVGLHIPTRQDKQLGRRELHYPLLAALAVYQQPQFCAAQKKALPRQRAQLRHPQPCAEQQFQYEDVPEHIPVARTVCAVCGLQDVMYRLPRYRPRQLVRRVDAYAEPVEGVVLKYAVQLESAVKCPHACQLALCRARGKRTVQMRDIPRQQLTAARRAPGELEVLPQIDAVGLDRVRRQPLPKLTGGQVFGRQSSHIHSETSVFIFAGFIMDWRGGLVNVCDLL